MQPTVLSVIAACHTGLKHYAAQQRRHPSVGGSCQAFLAAAHAKRDVREFDQKQKAVQQLLTSLDTKQECHLRPTCEIVHDMQVGIGLISQSKSSSKGFILAQCGCCCWWWRCCCRCCCGTCIWVNIAGRVVLQKFRFAEVPPYLCCPQACLLHIRYNGTALDGLGYETNFFKEPTRCEPRSRVNGAEPFKTRSL